MSYIVLSKQSVRALVTAARNIQGLMERGTIGDAFNNGTPDQVNDTICAFDNLAASAKLIGDADTIASPFLRYRREILGHYGTANHLRAMVMNLWGGQPANLSKLFMGADEHHTRIALECIAHYSQHGENDTFFMTLASEIMDEQIAAAMPGLIAIANGLSEVAA
jgi:hypothetical protein